MRAQAIANAARSELNAYLAAATSAAAAANGGANGEAANGDAAAAPVFHPDAEKFMLRQQLQVRAL